MKPDQLYHELNVLAAKMGVVVQEQNFRTTGIPVKSGSCIVHGKPTIIIDKHKSLAKKIKLLASALSKFPHDEIFAIPAVRDLLNLSAEERASIDKRNRQG